MFVIGLTGSLGMGKSTTARFFAEEGIPVHDADAVVHRLYAGEAAAAIEAAFPGTTADGKVDRNKLAARVLDDPAALNKLHSIMHQLVQAAEQEPLAQAERRVDAVGVVSAPAETQRARVLARPGMASDKLEAILARQMPDAEKRCRADFVVDTSHGLEAARAEVRAILDAVARMPQRRRGFAAERACA